MRCYNEPFKADVRRRMSPPNFLSVDWHSVNQRIHLVLFYNWIKPVDRCSAPLALPLVSLTEPILGSELQCKAKALAKPRHSWSCEERGSTSALKKRLAEKLQRILLPSIQPEYAR
jgi:hypothetical protein